MIQIDMPMPDNCMECRFNTSEFGYCNAMPVEFVGQVSDFKEDGKPEWCPLKAQEPRMMTLEEVKQHNNQDGCVWFEQPTYNADAAFVIKDDFMIQVISPYILGEPINHGYWTNGNYGKTWRCWTSRPTDEQREKEPWA